MSEVRIHRLPLDGGRLEALSAAERARAAKLVRPADRARFVAVHASARRILAAELNVAPDSLALDAPDGDKPRLAGIHFSHSRTDGLALLAVSRTLELGLDVERVDGRLEVEAMAAHSFTAREAAEVRAALAGERVRAFLRIWTRKEAFVKHGGEGMARDPRSFDVEEAPVRFVELDAGVEWIAVLAVAPDAAPRITWAETG